jgi:hypothetical protein
MPSPRFGQCHHSGRRIKKPGTAFLAQSYLSESGKRVIFAKMISLIDSEPPEPRQPGTAAVDVEFWKDAFSVLLPPEPGDESGEQEG